MNAKLYSWQPPRAHRWMLLGAALIFSLPRLAVAQEDADTAEEVESEEPPTDEAPSQEQEEADDEAAMEAEMEAELEAQEAEAAGAIMKKPPKGKGGLWGIIRDTKYNEPIIEAQVSVLGRPEKTMADLEGRYRLDLPPGTYRIRVVYELHQPSRVDEVVIRADELTRVDVQLVPDESAVEEVVIEETVDLTSTEGQTLSRIKSAAVGDGVGRAEIARTPDRNAAEAAQRVVGATIVGGRFVFVRGLGERYTNALLNGAPLPSPEPDRNTVPLDLFPSLVLDSLTIVKQFTPDMPGDFAGGSVRIQTRDFPKQPLFQLSLSGGYNTEATFRKRPGYYGSSTQWLGFDGGRRDFPPGIPERRLSTTRTSVEEQVGYGYRFNTPMATMRKATPPNHGLSLVAGDGYKLGANEKLGVLLAASYSHTYQIRKLTARKYRIGELPDGSQGILVGDDFSGVQGLDGVRWGVFANAALELDRRHTIGILALRSQTADDLTAEMEGEYQNSAGAFFHTNHLEYVSRYLNFVQLRGEHRYPSLNDLEIDWHASIAYAARQQPDTRDVRFVRAERDNQLGWEFTSDGSGLHSWFNQSDQTLAAGLDVQQPIITDPKQETKVKFGTLITSRDREFKARRFQLVPSRRPGELFDAASFCVGGQWFTGCPSQLFRPDLIRADGLLLDEWTLNLDQYETGLDVYAGYGMLDFEILPELRVVTGARAEITYQSFVGFDPFDRASTAVRSQIFVTDWLPALSVIYTAGTQSNIRLGASQTIARPQLREITPTLFTSFSGDVDVQGNEQLQLTRITNLDLRYEFFPTLREVLAASIFYKSFKRPIEEVVGANGKLGFVNADGAYAFGVEFEGRKTLDVLAPALKAFTLLGNVTIVTSEVDLGAQVANLTNESRPLSYQSPYIVNLALDYANEETQTDIRALYNVYGPRITAAGADELPDVYELPRHQIDVSVAQRFIKRLEVKLQAQNILGAPIVFAYRDQRAFKETINDDGSLTYTSMGRDPVVRRYNPGASFTLSATYTY